MIRSMTAFARSTGQGEWGTAVWEIKSVNHRFLELNLRLPESLRELEVPLREAARKKLERGKLDCQLRFQPGLTANAKFNLNEKLVQQLAETVEQVDKLFPKQLQVHAMNILSWPGVLEVQDIGMDEAKKAIMALFDETVDGLNDVRSREGGAIQLLIENRLKNILTEIETVKEHVPMLVQRQREKLLTRFEELNIKLDKERLEQEVVLLAQKLDIAEEIDRLTVHVNELQRILKKGGAVGRRIDFLLQELNREANTIASKSVDIKNTQVAVELKVLVEQIREQIQNLE